MRDCGVQTPVDKREYALQDGTQKKTACKIFSCADTLADNGHEYL